MADSAGPMHEHLIHLLIPLAIKRLKPLLPEPPPPADDYSLWLEEIAGGLRLGDSGTPEQYAAAFMSAVIKRTEAIKSRVLGEVDFWAFVVGGLALQVMIAEGHQGKTIDMLSDKSKGHSERSRAIMEQLNRRRQEEAKEKYKGVQAELNQLVAEGLSYSGAAGVLAARYDCDVTTIRTHAPINPKPSKRGRPKKGNGELGKR